MGCQDCTDLMSAFLDQELTDSQSQSVEKHVARCPDCGSQLESLRYSLRLTDSLGQIGASSDLWSRIESDIEPTTPAVAWRQPQPGPADLLRRWFWPGLATGTVALAAVLIVPPFLDRSSPHPFEAFLESRELDYQTNVSNYLASDSDFHRGHSNPFIRKLTHSSANPFR